MKWSNLLSPKKIAQAIKIEASAISYARKVGRPDAILHFLGGLGDELMLTCVAKELNDRGKSKIWQISSAAELLDGNPNYKLVLSKKNWNLRHSNYLEKWRIRLSYSEQIIPGVYELPPKEHIISTLCRKAGLTGTVSLRPYVHTTVEENEQGKYAEKQIVIHSIGEHTHETWMKNKSWYHDRCQEVVNQIKINWPEYTIIQVGVEKDPALENVIDLRGKLSLRQSALVVKNADCLISGVGFLPHLARAVDTRSVVVYGGREHAWQSGYICNENLESYLPCAPCWLWKDCNENQKCLKNITSIDVINGLERALSKLGKTLETQKVNLDLNSPKPLTYPKTPGADLIKNLPPFNELGQK